MIDVQTFDHEGYPVDADCPSARYVKREEYERLQAEVRALEQKRVELNVTIGERDAEIERLRVIETEARKVVGLLRSVGHATAWRDGWETDRVFAWYEFDGLRSALGEKDSGMTGDQSCCQHPVHSNPGLMAPCPECGADDGGTTKDTTQYEKVYPFMACPNERKSLDPLEGCSTCGGVGYHPSIPNPEWDNPPPGKRRWHELEKGSAEDG